MLIGLALGGKEFVLPYANMHNPYSEGTYAGVNYCTGRWCSTVRRKDAELTVLANVVGINTPANANAFFVLGDAFMIAMYSEFDMDANRVGFAYGI
jgi:hypothetical protein